MPEVTRFEHKYLLNPLEVSNLSFKMKNAFHEDPHNGKQGYMVRSLYFDSFDDRDYFQKENGEEVRRKMRLRIYSTDAETALLEMKQKEGEQQRKRSLIVSREDAEKFIEGDFTPLLKMEIEEENHFAEECYGMLSIHHYRPVTIVQYNRLAFVGKENRTRITFDSKIEATESNFDLFSPKLNMNPVIDPFATVLEVKYNGFLLSYYQNLLNTVDKSRLSVSKYVLARQQGFRTHL